MVFRCPEIDSLNTTYVLVPVLLYIIRNIRSRIYVIHWVVCSTPHALSPDALSPDTLSPRALSPHALSPNGLRNTCKNQALQVDFFRESIQSSISNIIYQLDRTFFITFYHEAHFHLDHQ